MTKLGGRPGLVVMGGDSCPKGHGSESQHHILDGHFSPIFLYKNCNVCLKKMKINEKEVRIGPFKKSFMTTLSIKMTTSQFFMSDIQF